MPAKYVGYWFWTAERDAVIERRWKAGDPRGDIATEVDAMDGLKGVKPEHIAKRAQSQGWRRPDGWKSKATRRHYGCEENKDPAILADWNAGMNRAALSTKYERPETTIWSVIQRARRRGEPTRRVRC